MRSISPSTLLPRCSMRMRTPSASKTDQYLDRPGICPKDRSPMGLRDYAILQLLATYGLRSGEISRLRLEDIDWRADILHIRRSKTGDHSLLPLFEAVGEALIDYLRHGRPETDVREIFVRTRAPYVPMVRIYSEVSRRIGGGRHHTKRETRPAYLPPCTCRQSAHGCRSRES